MCAQQSVSCPEPASPLDLAKAMSETPMIELAVPELLLRLRRSGGLFNLTWPDEETV
jgi:hypothetical protein